jgi:hypothetical protein
MSCPPNAPASPTVAAPSRAPTVPRAVTPPLVPGGTGMPVRMLRGWRALRPPNAVAQVSAAAAARLAVTIHSPSPGTLAPSSDPRPAAPPLA